MEGLGMLYETLEPLDVLLVQHDGELDARLLLLGEIALGVRLLDARQALLDVG